METEFRNVTITIVADSPKDAYRILCDALHTIGAANVEWTTTVYVAYTGDMGETDVEPRSTMELWDS